MTDLTDAIAAHKAAWQAFQDAPEGEASLNAEDVEAESLGHVLGTMPADTADVGALVTFLGWYAIEEVDRAGRGDINNLPFAYLRALAIALSAPRQSDILAKALVDAVAFDEHGVTIAGEFRGGNGGLLSNQTIAAAHALRSELLAMEDRRKSAPVIETASDPVNGITSEPSVSRQLPENSHELRTALRKLLALCEAGGDPFGEPGLLTVEFARAALRGERGDG